MLTIDACQKARLSRDRRFDGKFFTAVLTTGIFCRPICPARAPKSENVRYYQSAELAQQAGFRPCKRCFPELAPNNHLPIKLKAMIQSFDFSRDSIGTLAKRYNISARQIQRLFLHNFGLTPNKFFHHQRLLLARKLLKTSLSITDVCFASGFNSIRRFNETIKSAYQCSPSELRRRKIQPEKVNTVNTVEILLPYRPPFDWPLMLSFFRQRQMVNIEQVTEYEYTRTIAFNECIGWLKVTHDEGNHSLALTVNLSDFRYLKQVIVRVRTMFDLDADMNLIHRHLSSHPLLERVIKQYPGLRLPGCWDVFEFSIRAILGQQVSVKAATTLAKRIAEKYGESVSFEKNNLSKVFPTIAELKTAEFDDLGLTQSRKTTLKTWVQFYQSNPDCLEQYQSIDELEQQLTQLKGIGPWTVNYIAMRGLSDPDAFPSADLGVIKALTVNEDRPKNKDIIALAEQWRPWRAYAAIYLWHSLQLQPS